MKIRVKTKEEMLRDTDLTEEDIDTFSDSFGLEFDAEFVDDGYFKGQYKVRYPDGDGGIFLEDEVEILEEDKPEMQEYPIHIRQSIIQYDENVFVWVDETGQASGAASTQEEAEKQLNAYSRTL